MDFDFYAHGRGAEDEIRGKSLHDNPYAFQRGDALEFISWQAGWCNQRQYAHVEQQPEREEKST